jgi:uncharacterized DUF497 family protein
MSESSFEWDETKNRDNQRKHGVSFHDAQYAFLDTRRVIAKDLSYSQKEQRYYCFGLNREGTGILTVRLCIDLAASESLVRDTGARVRRSMSKRIRYSDEPIGEIKLVPDFLPSHEELALKSEQTKVTMKRRKNTTHNTRR